MYRLNDKELEAASDFMCGEEEHSVDIVSINAKQRLGELKRIIRSWV